MKMSLNFDNCICTTCKWKTLAYVHFKLGWYIYLLDCHEPFEYNNNAISSTYIADNNLVSFKMEKNYLTKKKTVIYFIFKATEKKTQYKL